MEKRTPNTNLVAALLVVIAVLGYSLIGKAGNLEPNDPPASTMKSLQEIYETVIDEGSGISQREGFCKYDSVSNSTTQAVPGLDPVPLGKRFVLLKIHAAHATYVQGMDWKLTVNDVELINGTIGRGGGEMVARGEYIDMEYFYKYEHDFPDRCVVLDAGETLKVVNDNTTSTLNVTLVGYFYDVP